MNAEQLRLDDAPAHEAGGFAPLRRTVHPDEAWWIPGERFYHVDAESLRYDHLAAYAVFGTVAEATAAGTVGPCPGCARRIAPATG